MTLPAALLVAALLAQSAPTKKLDLPMPPPPAPKKKAAPPKVEPIRLAMPGMSYANIDASLGDFFAEFLAQKLAENGIRVTTKSEVSSLVGLERQRQMLGCGEAASDCLAELAGALGVDGLVIGSIAKVGGEYAIAVKIISARDGQPIASASERLRNDKRVLDWMGRAARPLALRVRNIVRGEQFDPKEFVIAKEPRTTDADDPTEPKPASAYAWIPFTAGGVLLVGGGASYGLAKLQEADLRAGKGATDYPQLTEKLGQLKTLELAGFGMAGAAVAAGAVGVGLLLFGGGGDDAAPPKVTLVPGPGGFALVGVLP